MPENDNATAEQLERAEIDAELRGAVDRAKADPDRQRSISVSGATYARLRAYCQANNISMTSVVERLIKEALTTGPDSRDPDTDRADTSPA